MCMTVVDQVYVALSKRFMFFHDDATSVKVREWTGIVRGWSKHPGPRAYPGIFNVPLARFRPPISHFECFRSS